MMENKNAWIEVGAQLPKSGTHVLVHWKNTLDKSRISIGYYAAKYEVVYEDEEGDEYGDYSEEKDEYYQTEGWYESPWEVEYIAGLSGVTHWMPLPQTPNLSNLKP